MRPTSSRPLHRTPRPAPRPSRRGRLRSTLTALAAAAALVLAGCGDDGTSDGTSTASGTDGADHNEADVVFATAMIPHHAQALQMVEMAEGRDTSADLEQLLADIEAAQHPEIETMSGWLEAWGEEVPDGAATGGHDAHGHGSEGDHGDHGPDEAGAMPGMMSTADLDALAATPDPVFEDRWLQMMVLHHEGAVAMARTQQAEGEYAPAVELAHAIDESQTEEIETMARLLAD